MLPKGTRDVHCEDDGPRRADGNVQRTELRASVSGVDNAYIAIGEESKQEVKLNF